MRHKRPAKPSHAAETPADDAVESVPGNPSITLIDHCYLARRNLLRALNRSITQAYIRAFHACALRGLNQW